MSESQERELVRLQNGMSRSPYPQIREVVISLTSGGIVLTGTVSSFYMKQMAQETLRRLNGDHRICNKLKVAGGPEPVANDE